MAADQDLSVLKGAWGAACAAAGVGRYELAFQLIEYAYTAPERHYHNVRHIADCLRELTALRPTCRDPLAVEAALLFHDFEYNPTRHDNEERSADEAAMALRAVGWEAPRIQLVRGLILATRHAAPPDTPDAALVTDIDLAVFGKDEETFDAYELAIRREYAHVPDDVFRAARSAVLRGFLSRPRIYATDSCADRYEMKARQNLGRSLAALWGGRNEK
jgi:predicted metal-dependent HD superfamily phosphohydrolase